MDLRGLLALSRTWVGQVHAAGSTTPLAAADCQVPPGCVQTADTGGSGIVGPPGALGFPGAGGWMAFILINIFICSNKIIYTRRWTNNTIQWSPVAMCAHLFGIGRPTNAHHAGTSANSGGTELASETNTSRRACSTPNTADPGHTCSSPRPCRSARTNPSTRSRKAECPGRTDDPRFAGVCNLHASRWNLAIPRLPVDPC